MYIELGFPRYIINDLVCRMSAGVRGAWAKGGPRRKVRRSCADKTCVTWHVIYDRMSRNRRDMVCYLW